jgi:glycosyltransferase involved in cell wall biosynthesis
MKILIVAPVQRRLGPDVTASRSRIVYDLALQFIAQGHQVTILGTGDSRVEGATIVPVIEKCLSEMPAFENPFYAETAVLTIQAKMIEQLAPDFDIIHSHSYPEFINIFTASAIKTPLVTTLHAQAFPEYDKALASFPGAHIVSISEAHRSAFKTAKIETVIYHGLNSDVYAYQPKKEGYLLWIGRLAKARNAAGEYMDPKGIKWAIQLAEKTGLPLKLTGNVEDNAFYDSEVKPHLSETIQWIGPVQKEQPLSQAEVIKLMQGAKAFLMPNNWEEPFGLVMIEAMSCGTPVIGFASGSIPEIVKDGETGLLVNHPDKLNGTWTIKENGLEGLAHAAQYIFALDEAAYGRATQACRQRVLDYFTIDKMAAGYESLFKKLAAK